MRWLAAAVLVFALPTGDARRIARAADEDPFPALVREYDEARRKDFDRTSDQVVREFPARFLALARAHPRTPAARSALGWIVTHGPGGPQVDRRLDGKPELDATVETAIDILTQEHARDPAIGPLCPDLVHHLRSRAAEDLLRKVLEQNPTREARGLACLSLARTLILLSEWGVQRKLNPRTGGFCDRALAKRVRQTDPEKLGREADALLGQVAEEYADVEHQGAALGKRALAERAAFRDLAVGRTAPEIIGEDLDGKPMRLSEYRGKVIVLNFSSHQYCGICRAYYPFERAMIARLKDRPFAYLGVESDDDKPLVLKARDDGEITWRSWWDGGSTAGPIATKWNIGGWPTTFVIDDRGVIRYTGLVSDGMAMAVDALLEERDRDRAAVPDGKSEQAAPLPTRFDQVVDAADAIPQAVARAAVLTEVAAAWAKAEGHAAAQPTFERALNLTRGAIETAKDDRMRGFCWVRLALIQIAVGDRETAGQSLNQAMLCVDKIEHEGTRDDLFQFIAHIQADLGDVVGAQATSERSKSHRVGVLKDIAVGQARSGDVPGALATLNSIGSKESESGAWAAVRVLPEVAQAQVRSGNQAEARQSLQRARGAFAKLPRLFRTPGILAPIALAQAKADDRIGSRETFDRAIRDADDAEDFPAAEELASVARAQWEAGDKDAALKTLTEASERIAGRDHSLLIPAYLDLGMIDQALESARKAHDQQGALTLSPDVVRQLARAESRSGERSHALRWVTRTTSPMLRAYALLGYVEGLQRPRQ